MITSYVTALTKELSEYTPTKPDNGIKERRKIDRRLFDIVKKIILTTSKIFTNNQQVKLVEAMRFVAQKHQGRYRKDKITPYLHHPLEVALIIIELGIIDFKTTIAALLHDVVEDEGVTLKEIHKKFGASVRNIVDLLSKTENTSDAYWLRMKSEPDLNIVWRVITLKFADRTHYFLTTKSVSKESLERKKQETLKEFPELYIVIKRAMLKLYQRGTIKSIDKATKTPELINKKLFHEIRKHT